MQRMQTRRPRCAIVVWRGVDEARRWASRTEKEQLSRRTLVVGILVEARLMSRRARGSYERHSVAFGSRLGGWETERGLAVGKGAEGFSSCSNEGLIIRCV